MLLEALIFYKTGLLFENYFYIFENYLWIEYFWTDIDRRSLITSVCGSENTSAVYTNRSQLQDAASIWFLTRLAASIWDLWILFGSKRPIADYFCGSDVTPAVHKPLSITRRGFYLIYDCRICDPSRFVAAVAFAR